MIIFVLQLNVEENLEIIPILKATELISNQVGKSTALTGSKIIPYLFLPKDHTTYYRYDGSLTTPGCQESVIWFIFTEKLSISEEQVITVYILCSGHNMKHLYRVAQNPGDIGKGGVAGVIRNNFFLDQNAV